MGGCHLPRDSGNSGWVVNGLSRLSLGPAPKFVLARFSPTTAIHWPGGTVSRVGLALPAHADNIFF